ncbi:MAG: hypothetical protein ACK44W_07165, partial [Planctomycetota bacterium]
TPPCWRSGDAGSYESCAACRRPGAPCRGSGLYHRLRDGLRIEFPGKRALVVKRWSPLEPVLELYVESPEGARIETFGGRDERTAAGLRLALEPNPTSGWALRVTDRY